MLRIDQVQRLAQQHGLSDSVATRLGYKHLDWVSKDTDNQFSHYPMYQHVYDVPDVNSNYDWPEGIADLIKGGPSYKDYNDGLGEDSQGIFLIRDYQIVPNANTDSGWSIVYNVSYVNPDQALM